MKKHFIWIILFCFSFSAWSQNAMVRGHIKDTANNEPLPFVSLTFEQNGTIIYKTETDFDGNYKVIKIKPGTYTIRTAIIHYHSKIVEALTINAGDNKLNIYLQEMTKKEKKEQDTREVTVETHMVPIKKDSTNSGKKKKRKK